MRIYRSLDEVPADFGPSVLSIGNFDGVHFGHRRILRRVRELAVAHGWKPSVLTFDPHPTRVVAPQRTPPLLTSPERRAALMCEEGIAQVLILPFTRELALLTPEEFVERLLVKALGARAVLVGDNFHFGHKQAGNVAVLAGLGRKFGFDTGIVPAVTCRGRVVSSSGIRELIRAGKVSLAARLLQLAYGLEGEVVSGRGVGSKQTVPTLNLATTAEVIPANGVYITRTRDNEDERQWNSITNIGYRPTFGASEELTIETFLLNPNPDREGGVAGQQPLADARGSDSPNPNPDRKGGVASHTPRHIRVEFLRRVREERKFESPEALRAQILKDVRTAQTFFRRIKAWDGTGMHFLLNGLSIVLIDLLLAGDNALVIALAVRTLPPRERRIGIIGGAGAAVLLRVALTAVAARLLTIEYLQIAGGLLILWIAIKVLMDASTPPDAAPRARHFWQAIWYIVVADLTMSTDNVLAIAGASKGNFWLIAFGLALSIPFVVLSSTLLSKLMDRYPALLYLGAGILGKVGGEMILTDPLVVRVWGPTELVKYAVEAVLVIAVIVVGRILCRGRGPTCPPTP